MYKPIWDLIFKCNGSEIQFNLIQFSQEYIAIKEMWEKKKKIKQEHKM
jgi:transcriptional regulator of NAD metabolism